MEIALRPREHGNLYYLFLMDQAENPMPEERMQEVLRFLETLFHQQLSRKNNE